MAKSQMIFLIGALPDTSLSGDYYPSVIVVNRDTVLPIVNNNVF